MRTAFGFFPFLLIAGLFAGLPGCTASTSAPSDVRGFRPDSPDGSDSLQTIRLDPADAARRADSIRQQTSVQVADGLALSLWAVDPLAPDPIALTLDDQGRAYITRTNRQKNSEFDIRGHRDWMTPSIALETVESRRRFLRETFAPEKSAENEGLPDLNGDGLHDWRDLAVEKEQVFRIEDTSGDGVADLSQVIVEDFHEEVTDVAGAVLVHEGDVFLGVAPDLWRMRDTDGDGLIDEKTSISSGYGVHIGFSGHGMSGLTTGPDGRIYWSIGDIGFSVVDGGGRRWAYPNQGAILRAEPDGSDFEVVAAGLRNTHEFVFDAYGNLISVDNDGDHPGEQERLVHLIDGSDSGWRANWQYGKYTDPDNNAYKVWMAEELYKPRFEGQAAYLLPPIASYHAGPAGMAYNPGTALGEAWRERFFIAEFTGSPARSHVYAFRLEPSGASFKLAEEKEVTSGLLATGLDFGPDGALYVADWLDGWGTKDRGRIWKLDVEGADTLALRRETAALLAADFDERSTGALADLLHHPDMRVRQKAQFELAERGEADVLLAAARQTDHLFARLHGLWGLGQLARQGHDVGGDLAAFLNDADAEVRAQAAKTLGDVRYTAAGEGLLPLLEDEAPRVRLFAAEALGRIAHAPATEPILAMLEANDDADAHLRHAGAIALARIGDADRLVALADHPSRAVRVAAVVALRRLGHVGVARFLDDEDEYVVTEAARAINDDLSVEAALPELARVLHEDRFTSEALLRRALNAAHRLGTAEHAAATAAFAARTDAPEATRVEALASLGVWPNPSVLDRVDGRYRGLAERDASIARSALAPVADSLLTDGRPPIQIAAAEAVGRLAYAPAAPTLLALLRNDPAPDVRIAALEALRAAGYADMEEAAEVALADSVADVRMGALRLLPELDLPDVRTAELLASVLGRQTVEEEQAALEALGALGSAASDSVLAEQFDRLLMGDVRPALQLDLLEALEASGDGALADRLAQYRAAQPADDPMAAYRVALEGGDPGLGAQLFYRHEAAQCVRCHAVGDWGGGVGPNLTDVATVLDREALLESLVAPSARIAPGYGTVAITLESGETLSGTVRSETDSLLVLDLAEGEARPVAKTDVAQRYDAASSMPPMGPILSRRQIRDLVAFLATLDGLEE